MLVDRGIILNGEHRDPEFAEAANYWYLEKLYLDLTEVKGKSLTPVEKKFLRGLLCGYSPAEIAQLVYQSRSSSAVRVSLSNGLYKYIQELLIRQTGEIHKIKSWSRVTNLLTKAGYKLATSVIQEHTGQTTVSALPLVVAASLQIRYENRDENWQERIDVSQCYGRDAELQQLTHWILHDRCRLLCLWGLAGVGKTLLAGRLSQQIQGQFSIVIWRSLGLGTRCEELLTDLLQTLMPDQGEITGSVASRMNQLLDYLRSHRCLILLDQLEPLFVSHCVAGIFRPGEELYGELLRRLAQEQSRSCILLISREKPQDFNLWEGEQSPIRSLQILGLATPSARSLLVGLAGSEWEFGQLVERYGGNPLALKGIASIINDLFNSKITNFLFQRTFFFSNMRSLWRSQLARLSEMEQKMLDGMVLFPQGLAKFPLEGMRGMTHREQLEAVDSLRRRAMLEKQATGFMLSPLVRNYLAEE